MNVSVVIPTLNERYALPNCLDALKPQLAKGDEVIIVDGGSDDGTRQLVRDYGCVLVEADETTVGTARGIGVNVAQNEIIVSADADSIPPQGWLDKIKSHFVENEDLVVLWGSIEDRNGVPIRSLTGKFTTLGRGASGNNTAFRKSAYDKLNEGYPDVNFAEDYFIINQLAKMGEVRRDKDLVMVMDMDRSRYQTLPIVTGGLSAAVLGTWLGGRWGDVIRGSGVGAAGTEMVFENFTGTNRHHDELGLATMAVGLSSDEWYSNLATGLGFGVLAHHVLTEGLSLAPTELMRHTDMVINS